MLDKLHVMSLTFVWDYSPLKIRYFLQSKIGLFLL